MAKGKEERRGFLRVDDVTEISYSPIEEEPLREAKTLDLGGGGIRLISKEEIPPGTTLSLRFDLPSDPPASISCKGKVAWSEEVTEEGETKYQQGITFIDVDEANRQKIIRYTFTKHYQLKKTEEVAIEVNQIKKSYGKLQAVKGVSLKIKVGEIFALLGPNGAGKTTLTRILSTLLYPTSGSAKVLGLDIIKDKREIRRLIGYMPQNYILYDDLTARENLEFFGKAYGLRGKALWEQVDEALAFTELERRGNDLFRTFSGGMKQRLSLACALLHRPKILFLDEPTAGVDLKLRKSFWDYFHQLSQTGVTVFITTHQMDEVEYCYRVAFMNLGEIIIDDTPKNIKSLGRTKLILTVDGKKESFEVKDYSHDSAKILRDLGERSRQITSIEFEESSLEEILREKARGEELRD